MLLRRVIMTVALVLGMSVAAHADILAAGSLFGGSTQNSAVPGVKVWLGRGRADRSRLGAGHRLGGGRRAKKGVACSEDGRRGHARDEDRETA